MFSLINFSFEESVPWWSPVVVPESPRWRVPWWFREPGVVTCGPDSRITVQCLQHCGETSGNAGSIRSLTRGAVSRCRLQEYLSERARTPIW